MLQPIEGVFSAVKRNDRSIERVADAFSAHGDAGTHVASLPQVLPPPVMSSPTSIDKCVHLKK